MANNFFITTAGYFGSSSLKYLPLAHGTQSELTSLIDSSIDNTNFVIPFDLSIEKIFVNMTRSMNSDPQPGNTKISLWKAGEKYSDDVNVSIEGLGYDTYDLNEVRVFDFKDQPNTYKAGEIMQITMQSENIIDYFSMTITGEYL